MSFLLAIIFLCCSQENGKSTVVNFVKSLMQDGGIVKSKKYLTKECIAKKRFIPIDTTLQILKQKILGTKSYEVLAYKTVKNSPNVLTAKPEEQDSIYVIKLLKKDKSIEYIYFLVKNEFIVSYTVVLKGGSNIDYWE